MDENIHVAFLVLSSLTLAAKLLDRLSGCSRRCVPGSEFWTLVKYTVYNCKRFVSIGIVEWLLVRACNQDSPMAAMCDLNSNVRIPAAESTASKETWFDRYVLLMAAACNFSSGSSFGV